VLTGRGADIIILDDILKPDDALSETRRRAANDWYFNTLLSRLNSKEHGVIIIVMQRLHQEDLVGEVTDRGSWEIEQSFNSLDAQREACEAYIRSQRHEGWHAIGSHYDDGGFSGGNMERPGFVVDSPPFKKWGMCSLVPFQSGVR
jgi:hypothetical protein